ncbi:uncharacterized protein EV154DRAFT_559095 [Mucor mucedo]|uniref:uncharacterized protein n=1 Tax=Mucor mucedo TaxID=29922 RepID=UPI00221FD24B|nr:uncharacterized protein EV154DRAFT_559095 [Mucor mucedo]KAI7895677.1 hypothetical protein EV154DRAFT_559095 [Mucor mucedo]
MSERGRGHYKNRGGERGARGGGHGGGRGGRDGRDGYHKIKPGKAKKDFHLNDTLMDYDPIS